MSKIVECWHCGQKNRINNDNALVAKCGKCSSILFDYRDLVQSENNKDDIPSPTQNKKTSNTIKTITIVVTILIGLFWAGIKLFDNSSKIKSDIIDTKISSSTQSIDNQENTIVHLKRYSELPIKANLSYFVNPTSIAGQVILSIDNSPLSSYQKGLEFGSGRNIRQENLQYVFNIDRYRVHAIATAEIDSTSFSEFEIDDFEQRLKEEFASSVPSILRESYKSVDKHIRITNLNIPVKYSKESKSVAIVEIEDVKSLKTVNYSKQILPSDFIKKALNNPFISKYIIDSKKRYSIEASVNYQHFSFYDRIKIKGNKRLLNNIGKVNKGNDTITELTLYAWDIDLTSNNTFETKFAITSFKLKSTNKRFILNYYVDKLVSAQPYQNSFYIIRDNDFPMFIKKDKS